MQLDGRVALVTGAGSGIGQASARLLAREGAKVALVGRTESELDETRGQIESAGGTALAVEADVARPDAVERAVRRVEQAWGRLDVVLANAGVNGVWAPIEELDPDEWNETLAINLTGSFLTLKYAAPLLKRRGGSAILVASVNGTRIFSNTGATAYACSKAGQVALAKMVALELAPHRVRVNAICPGAIESPIHDKTERRHIEKIKIPAEYPEGEMPLTGGKMGSPEQVARLVLFLASDASDLITGSEIFIDGAESLLRG
ncbi:MAG TPA: SDR family NAD(P)-dependent oxidoreductase [Isosphaeraceae bacterium]|jgi:NAD(P)-dependent dehydrogenase (short-subunit alcohol dehydrogenase family)